jgi:hypothetical protein
MSQAELVQRNGLACWLQCTRQHMMAREPRHAGESAASDGLACDEREPALNQFKSGGADSRKSADGSVGAAHSRFSATR